jgi:hypothetical protein
MKEHMAKFDQDNDGKMSQHEFELYKQNETLKATLEKQTAQQSMAWTAIIVIICVTALLFVPFISSERIAVIIPMLDLFYVSMASIVGAFMGITAWMSRR